MNAWVVAHLRATPPSRPEAVLKPRWKAVAVAVAVKTPRVALLVALQAEPEREVQAAPVSSPPNRTRSVPSDSDANSTSRSAVSTRF